MSDELYNVERILDRRKVNGKFEYKIKWEGYSMNQCTWEPMKNLESVKELVDEFDLAHPENDEKNTKNKNFIHKKRNHTKIKSSQKSSEDEISKDIIKIEEEPKDNLNENELGISYPINDSLKNVCTVKMKNGKLEALVEKLNENGEIEKTYIETSELRKTNPWILLDFYESKIKFT